MGELKMSFLENTDRSALSYEMKGQMRLQAMKEKDVGDKLQKELSGGKVW